MILVNLEWLVLTLLLLLLQTERAKLAAKVDSHMAAKLTKLEVGYGGWHAPTVGG